MNSIKKIIYLFVPIGLDEKETRKENQKQVQRSRVKPSTSDAMEVCSVQSYETTKNHTFDDYDLMTKWCILWIWELAIWIWYEYVGNILPGKPEYFNYLMALAFLSI